MIVIDFAIGFLLLVIGVLLGTLLGLFLGERFFFVDRRHLGDDE